MTPAFPRKRISVGALVTNPTGELLIVKPGYRDGWLLPGGIVDANESPAEALKRELMEELGLALVPKTLLSVDYTCSDDHYAEGINLRFDCGILNDTAGIRLLDAELVDLRFCTPNDALSQLSANVVRRLRSLDPPRTVYLENGVAPSAWL